MSDHEFERQVQQKMDELRLRPSADVWKAVAMELDQDKKRRRAILWWPAALLLLIGGGYFVYRCGAPLENGGLVARHQDRSATIVTPTTPAGSSGLAPSAVNPRPQIAPLAIASTNHNAESQPSSAVDYHKTSIVRNRPASLNNAVRPKGSFVTVDNTSSFKDNHPLPHREAAINDDNSGLLTNSANPGDHAFRAAIYTMPGVASIQTGRHMQGAGASSLALVPTASSPSVNKKTARKNGWSIGVTAQAGMSGSNTGGLLNFQGASVVDLSGGILNAALPSNTIIYRSSVIRPGAGFSVGAFAQRSFHKRIDVSAGLSFNRFNQSVMVGRKVYSSVQVNADRLGVYSAYPYYTRDAEMKYAVHYDFIELPVRVQYNVNPSSKIPVSLNAGIITSRLIGSNAVHFDGSSAGYFKNNALLNNWQVGANAGIAFTLMSKTSRPLTIGPSFRYQVSNTLSSQVGASRHILGVGLEVRMPLKNF